jgi:cytochrome c peroxidase
MKSLWVACVASLSLLTVPALAYSDELSPLEELGKKLFFDPGLSTPPGQSCATCHDPVAGWTGPDSIQNDLTAVYPGAIGERYGNRKPPSSAYVGFNPVLHRCGDCGGACGGGMGGGGMGDGGGMGCAPGDVVGGLFWDGRATGWLLGDPLAEQAMAPFLNPLEQNNPNARHVCLRVAGSDYVELFEQVWGEGSLDCARAVQATYERIGRSIAAYERSAEVNPFSSKFDRFWDDSSGRPGPRVWAINTMNWTRFRGRGLDDMELQGLLVFNTKGNCSVCHPLRPMRGSEYPLFTDFRYHNLGLPRNADNPFYDLPRIWNPDGEAWIDAGLGRFLATVEDPELRALAAENVGKHKTPSLRNVDKRLDTEFMKAYGHNGYFKSLQEIIHFYNLRDVLPTCEVGGTPGMDCWPVSEVTDNVDRVNLGNLGLTPPEGMALIAFLRTLDDGFAQPAE